MSTRRTCLLGWKAGRFRVGGSGVWVFLGGHAPLDPAASAERLRSARGARGRQNVFRTSIWVSFLTLNGLGNVLLRTLWRRRAVPSDRAPGESDISKTPKIDGVSVRMKLFLTFGGQIDSRDGGPP